MTKYKQAKQTLKTVSLEAKKNYSSDRPMIRMIINDYSDHLIKDYSLTEYQSNLLSNYACTLHPKN